MRRSKRRKRIVRLGILAALLAAVITVLVLFQVRKINVYGNSRYDAQEIADGLMHSFLTKNSLYLAWEYRDETVSERMPYLGSVKVKLKSPFEIDVTVEEKELAGYVEQASNWYFDEDGILLENTQEVYDGIPKVTGADVGEPVLYQKLPTRSSAQLRTILSITQLLRQQELAAEQISFEENGDITVLINGVEAKLGQDEYMEEKIANLRAILERTAGQTGTLHMESFTGKNGTATFQITGEAETEAQTDSQDEQDGGADASEGQDGADGSGEEQAAEGDSTGEGADADNQDNSGEDSAEDSAEQEDSQEEDTSTVIIAMVFDSSGTLVYNVHNENGTVVDSNGNAVAGCYVDGDGYVVDAYMNRFDPQTGELVQ